MGGDEKLVLIEHLEPEKVLVIGDSIQQEGEAAQKMKFDFALVENFIKEMVIPHE